MATAGAAGPSYVQDGLKPMAKSTAKKAPQKPAGKTAAKAAPKAAKPASGKTAPAKAKPAAAKAAAAKPAAKPSAKPAAKPAASAGKAAAQPKAAAKPAPKQPAAAKAKPEPKPARPTPAKNAAGQKKDAKPAAKEAPAKSAKAEPKAPAKPVAPRKKLNVGQKPRTDKSAEAPRPIITTAPPREEDVAAPVVKATPASREAKQTFKVNDHVVYPAHGVGRIVGIEKQHIAGITNELFVIGFEQEKMKLRVPTAKAMMVGMRALADDGLVKKAVDLLKGRARIKRTMWSRRAQEYEAKINSGDILAVAEVVRDLYRATDQPEQSYSERQLFEAALDRLAREVAAVRKTDLAAAIAELEGSLQQKRAA